MQSIKKIVVIGPESTGKSTLCNQLAQHYNTDWVPEFAREYLERNGTNYTYESLLTIANGQVALEEEYINKKVKSQKSKINLLNSPFTTHHSPLTTHFFLLIQICTL